LIAETRGLTVAGRRGREHGSAALAPDLVAGATTAAVVVPSALAYASLAGPHVLALREAVEAYEAVTRRG
jgi:hypothetical protein